MFSLGSSGAPLTRATLSRFQHRSAPKESDPQLASRRTRAGTRPLQTIAVRRLSLAKDLNQEAT